MCRGVRELSPLQPGETVWMTDCSCEAQVSEEVAMRSYEVTPQESTFRRNRRDLNVLPNPETDQSVAEHPKVPQQQQTGENPTGSQPLHRTDPHVTIWTQHNFYLYLHLLKKGRCSVSCFIVIIELWYGCVC